MHIAYFDCFAGISGDTLLASLLDAGLSLDSLRAEIDKLPLKNCHLEVERVARQGIAGVCIYMAGEFLPHSYPMIGRTSRPASPVTPSDRVYSTDLASIISESSLPAVVKQTSLCVLKRIAEAEARVRVVSSRQSQLPETYSVRTLIEITGSIAGLALLGIDRVECSPLHVGGGMIRTEQGLVPALAPVTAEILRAASVPIYGSDVNSEMVTPTGAAVINTVASAFGPMPAMRVESVGYGACPQDGNQGYNLLRLMLGEATISFSTPPPAATPDSEDKAAPPEEWIPLTVTGHQHSGRQRVISKAN
ncbi:MAG: LarC family nickel insertion protein [Chloroflexi bacterium]|nr:LarC family nickel insertion protein [Chloroflexota bacterium]